MDDKFIEELNEMYPLVVVNDNGESKLTIDAEEVILLIEKRKKDIIAVEDNMKACLKKEMENNSCIEVRAEIELEHKNIDYKITRTQLYRKDAFGVVKGDSPKLSISQKDKFGNTSFNDINESLSIINGILPESLSKYFFFSGERIDTMSKEALKGKVSEFKNAV